MLLLIILFHQSTVITGQRIGDNLLDVLDFNPAIKRLKVEPSVSAYQFTGQDTALACITFRVTDVRLLHVTCKNDP